MIGNKTSQSMMEATVLCQDQLEYAKQLGYEKVDTLHNKVESYGSIPEYALYKRITAVTPVPSVGTKQVSVRVFWGNDAHSFELQTALSQR
jgi:hypothetical protein